MLALFRSLGRNCVLRMCAITFPRGSLLPATFHIIFHIWPIPNISIIFCRRGSVGAGVPRGFYQLIKVLRKETGQAIRGPVGAQQQLHSGPKSNLFGFSSNIFGFVGLKAPSNRWTAGRIPCFAGVRPKRCGVELGRPSAGKKRPESLSLSLSLGRDQKIRFSQTSSCSKRQEGGFRATRSNSCN